MKNSASVTGRCCGAVRAALWCTLAGIPLAHAHDAAADVVALTARHAELRKQLSSNQFQRPLYLESSEVPGKLQGDIYALVEQPYAVVGPALQHIDRWCDILILHLNVKRCHTSTAQAGGALSLHIGRKFYQPLADAFLFNFRYRMVFNQPDYLQVTLHANEGPLGTKRYNIALEVLALDAGRSFLHLSYSYGYGMAARAATAGYLATLGRDKVGFSIVGNQADGQPVYLDGMRGVVERNTMRYYLAIDAYLGALVVAPSERSEKRLNDWYASVERYPDQLHEMERGEYLDMKRREIQRQQMPRGAGAVD